jgi:hypothetical protein
MAQKIDGIEIRVFAPDLAIVKIQRGRMKPVKWGNWKTYDAVTPASLRRCQRAQVALMTP